MQLYFNVVEFRTQMDIAEQELHKAQELKQCVSYLMHSLPDELKWQCQETLNQSEKLVMYYEKKRKLMEATMQRYYVMSTTNRKALEEVHFQVSDLLK